MNASAASSVMTGLDSDQVAVGVAGLDAILLGGLSRHNQVLLEGPAGTGKTSLALSFLYAGAVCHDEPGLLISCEVSPSKLLRDARGFGWELDGLLRCGMLKVLEITPAVLLKELRASEGALVAEWRALGIKRLVIDGLGSLGLSHDTDFRSSLQQLSTGLRRLGMTVLITRVTGAAQMELAEARSVFDTVIALDRTSGGSHQRAKRTQRTIEVLKSRGQDFIAGKHTLRLEAGRGVAVYQRASSRVSVPSLSLAASALQSFGSEDLDRLLGGGLYPGSVTLISGSAGTGKTVAGLQFLAEGAQLGEPGLLISLAETPAQLLRNAQSLELDLDALSRREQLVMLHEAPLELSLDVHFESIVTSIERHQIQRVVFDSVSLYEQTNPDEAVGFLLAIAGYCKARGLLTVLNYESPDSLATSQVGELLHGSQLVDNLIVLGRVTSAAGSSHTITVPKARGRRNLQVTRPYAIEVGGLSLLDDQTLEDRAELRPYPSLHGRENTV